MDTLQDIKIAIIEPCAETTTIKNLIMEKHIAKINENIFLDGACDIFADALNKEYGYPIYELVNAQSYKIEPMKYSDIYTKKIISCVRKCVVNLKYVVA